MIHRSPIAFVTQHASCTRITQKPLVIVLISSLSLSISSSPTRFDDSSSPHTWTFRQIGAGHHQLRVIHAAGQSEAPDDRRSSASFGIRGLTCLVRLYFILAIVCQMIFSTASSRGLLTGVFSAEHASLTFACPQNVADKQEEREAAEKHGENLGVKARGRRAGRSNASLQIGSAFLGVGVTEEASVPS